MAPRKKTAAAVPAAPAPGPNLLCPFTGTPLKIKSVRNGLYWQAEGAFYSTKLYHRKEELLFDISTRDGVKPGFARSAIEVIGVREKPPENPIQDIIDRAKEDASMLEGAMKHL